MPTLFERTDARTCPHSLALLLLLTLFFAPMSCSDESDVTGPLDDTPPNAITDLSVVSSTESSTTLMWTAPTDPLGPGHADSYDLRYHVKSLSETTWSEATVVANVPGPGTPGDEQSFEVADLGTNVRLEFALKSTDPAGNTSDLSNVVVVTLGDPVAPGAITDLEVTEVASEAVTLRWTAPGKDGAAGTVDRYEFRYSTAEITDSIWAEATQAETSTTPEVAGTSQTARLGGLDGETSFWLGIRSYDGANAVSDLSNIVATTTTTPGVRRSWAAAGTTSRAASRGINRGSGT